MQSPLPHLALLANAFIWGLAWWPFRTMLDAGLHPLWATALMYGVISCAMLALRPGLLGQLRAAPLLWLLALNAGITNLAFNWAMAIGDVVRVVLLFYLMPAWSVLLAWRVLGERPSGAAVARLLLAFAGVALVLWPRGGAAPLATGPGLADLLALLGGLTFAATSVLLRRLSQATAPAARMGAMFGGCALTTLAAASAGWAAGVIPAFPAFDTHWALVAALLACALLLGNWALQFGAARLPAATTSLVLLSEVLFASASSIALGAASPSWATFAGGALIMGAALLAALQRGR